jgi:hypothetical protein
VKLSDAGPAIRAALERLAESPLELRCFVIIQDTLPRSTSFSSARRLLRRRSTGAHAFAATRTNR